MELKPGYKQTEVGVVPADWEVTKGESITDLIGKGGSPRWQGFEYMDQGMLFVTSENVRDGSLDLSHPKYLPIAFHEKLKRTKLKRGDILINLVGASIGRSCQIRTGIGDANVNQAVAVFRVADQDHSDFVAHYLQAPATIRRMLAMQADAARPNISLGDLRRFPLPLPPVLEQRVIAQALGDVDGLLGELDRLITKKRDLKQAAMQQLLTGQTRLPGFSGESERKCTDVGSIPDDWHAKSLRDVCVKIQDGTHFSPAVRGGEFLYVTSKNIGFGLLDVSDAPRIDGAQHRQIYRRCDPKHGDLLLTKDGASTGNAALNTLEEEFSLLSSVALLRFDPRHHCSAYFLQQVLSNDGQRRIKEEMSGNAITRLTLTKIGRLKFPVCTVREQAAIAEVLSDMDAEIAALVQRRDKTRDLKQGMMQELLTGRTRLV